MTPPKPHLEVQLHFLRPEEGGREHPVHSGFRMPHDFYGESTLHDAMHTYFDQEEVQPGESVRAHLTLLYPEAHVGRLSVGQRFEVRQGAPVIAHGEIAKILDPELEKHPSA